MKGCRPLDTNEILKISEQFDGTFEIRNRSLFMLGVSVGGRISELLALKISDVWQNGQPVSDLLFQKRVVKGRETARMIPVNADGQQAIRELIQWHTGDFITEMMARGLDVSSIVQQLKDERQPKKVAVGSKIIAFQSRNSGTLLKK